ncbi:intercompartmental signaling factor BofC [Halalkalibacterium ligniniphilum]|uniref:intercompartmental signaling factor BofC n=1 Tax=Halalkalibacterium ligniniphilum TaxID=1134413 RepID=UPI00034BF630|nr:intercompartmental signaling factor BofC [Halalkalibacterium ligniniphilum]
MKTIQRFTKLHRYLLVCFLFFIGCLTVVYTYPFNEPNVKQETPFHAEPEVFEVMAPKTMTVILEKVYLDGEKSEEQIVETIWAMEDFWADYEDWTLIKQENDQMVFRKHVKDISPLLKAKGYFGVSDEGILRIYEGLPNEENVIQSFFQLDTEKLRSQEHTKLKQGIPVKSLQHYEAVLKVYDEYKASEL